MITFQNSFTESLHPSLWEVPVRYNFENLVLADFSEDFKIFEIRGCNGSGKSTLPKLIIKNDHIAKKITIIDSVDGEFPIVLSFCPTFKTIIIGSYPENANCGGCDRISGNEKIAKAVEVAVEYTKSIIAECGSGWRILFEGIMASTTCTGIVDMLLERDNGIGIKDLHICFMDTPLDKCIERIKSRNSGKLFKELGVSRKHIQVNNQPERLAKEYPDLKLLSIKNSETSDYDKILPNWIQLNFKSLF